MNLAAQLPGWTRFRPAQEWLDQRTTPAGAGNDLALKRSFEEFLGFLNETGGRGGQSASLLSREALFARFLDGRKQQQEQGASGVTGPLPPPAAAARR